MFGNPLGLVNRIQSAGKQVTQHVVHGIEQREIAEIGKVRVRVWVRVRLTLTLTLILTLTLTLTLTKGALAAAAGVGGLAEFLGKLGRSVIKVI